MLDDIRDPNRAVRAFLKRPISASTIWRGARAASLPGITDRYNYSLQVDRRF